MALITFMKRIKLTVAKAIMGLSLFSCLNFIQAETAYFLVAEAEGPQKEAFLLPLHDEEDIDHARAILAARSLQTLSPGNIVRTKIKKENDGLNRNYLAPGAPQWSWRVTGEVEFTDRAIDWFDGSPGFVESDPDEWISSRDGNIGFWSYTVVAEMSVPLIVWVQPTPEAVEVYWMDLGPNYVYTVEIFHGTTDKLWIPAGRQVWPISGTNWVDTSFSGDSPMSTYRVRAQKVIAQ